MAENKDKAIEEAKKKAEEAKKNQGKAENKGKKGNDDELSRIELLEQRLDILEREIFGISDAGDSFEDWKGKLVKISKVNSELRESMRGKIVIMGNRKVKFNDAGVAVVPEDMAKKYVSAGYQILGDAKK